MIRYGTYLLSIWRRQTTPHVFSWGVWGLVTGIAAAAQFKLGGGPSSWVLAVVSASCLLIAFLALFVGEKTITKSDWAALSGTLLTIIFWQLTDNPMVALACVMLVDIVSYWPTIRKSWMHPGTEPPGSYFWAGLRYFLAIFAVPDMRLDNLLYPFFLMAIDWGFMIYIIWRRRVLKPA
jgi:hypothetical protein